MKDNVVDPLKNVDAAKRQEFINSNRDVKDFLESLQGLFQLTQRYMLAAKKWTTLLNYKLELCAVMGYIGVVSEMWIPADAPGAKRIAERITGGEAQTLRAAANAGNAKFVGEKHVPKDTILNGYIMGYHPTSARALSVMAFKGSPF